MHLIVGLGNPGQKYLFTRHNIGFMAIDYVLSKLSLVEKTEHKALTYKFKHKDKDILFIKPQTFMNLSGESVQALMAYYKIELENILVIHDDIDQNFLSMKLQKNSSSGGQNGIKSIHEKLGTENYSRLKLGIGRPTQQEVVNYVLQSFGAQEENLLPFWLEEIQKCIFEFVDNGYERAANKYNFKAPHFSKFLESGKIDTLNNFADIKSLSKELKW